MGHRLSRIYTRTGDDGTTGLADGSRVPKDSPRVEALGTVDELNSWVGAILVHELPTDVSSLLVTVQHALFDIGGELAIPEAVMVTEGYVARLERALDEHNARLPPLKEFILPGGGPASVAAHVARSVCRRAERRLYTLSREAPINPHALTYLNRLSDLLFVLARSLAIGDRGEVYWDPSVNKT